MDKDLVRETALRQQGGATFSGLIYAHQLFRQERKRSVGPSCRRVASQPGHTVEVGVMAGQVAQTVFSHNGHHQCIIAEQSGVLADPLPPGLAQIRRFGRVSLGVASETRHAGVRDSTQRGLGRISAIIDQMCAGNCRSAGRWG